MALTIGNKLFSNNLIQGPLAGVSSAPFRRLAWRYSQPAYCYTEMISCKTILHASLQQVTRYTTIEPNEGPVCFQLASNHPTEVAEATKKVTDLGASLIDLNCGCPVKKIRKKGAGSRLLTEPSVLYRLIQAMRTNTHLPISIKIRVEGESQERFHREIATVIQDAGADVVVVHGRHWTEHYETPCRHEQIAYFVNEMKIPVIGNGDIRCPASLNKMLETGCAGVMLARATVGQPWLIASLMNPAVRPPSLSDIGEIYIEHTHSLAKLLSSEKHAVLEARKLAKYYARSLLTRDRFVRTIQACDDLALFTALCRQYFQEPVNSNETL